MMGVRIRLDTAAIAKVEKAARMAAVEALEQVYQDLTNAATMPFYTGDMQNNQTYVEPSEKGAVLITGSPQARRLYYHPEYHFSQPENSGKRGALWLEPYITGTKKDFVKVEYEKALKEKL